MILQPWLFSAAYPMLWAEPLSQANSRESRPSRFGPHLPAGPRTRNSGQGGLELEFMTAASPRRLAKGGRSTEARAFHELLVRPRRLIRDGPRHAAIGTGQLDEKRMHYGSSRSNRLRTHADESNLMSETQRTTIDTARDSAHTHRRV